MPGHSTHQPHGSGVRGLNSPSRYRRTIGTIRSGCFSCRAATFTEDDLFALAEAMKGEANLTEGPDPEESDFGAAYTYFGQFVDHDLTFDPSTFQQQKSDPNAHHRLPHAEVRPRQRVRPRAGRPAVPLRRPREEAAARSKAVSRSSATRTRATCRAPTRRATARAARSSAIRATMRTSSSPNSKG